KTSGFANGRFAISGRRRLEVALSETLEVPDPIFEIVRSEQRLSVKRPKEVLGARTALSVVALKAGSNHVAVAVVTVGSGNHVLDHEVVAAYSTKAVEALLTFSLEDPGPILRHLEEIDLLQRRRRRIGRKRDYARNLSWQEDL